MSEQWLPVVGYEGKYEVSDMGDVRSIERVDVLGRPVPAKILKPQKIGPRRNYLSLGLASGETVRDAAVRLARTGATDAEIAAQLIEFRKQGNRTTQHRVHRLVLEAFVGPCPAGHECAHDNGDSLDNRLSNLAWKTPSENAQDKKLHGTDYHLNKTHCPRGHEYTQDNIYGINGGKGRACKTCALDRARNQEAPKNPRTHCRKGHEMTPDNISWSGNARKCRTCYNARMRARYAAKRSQS